LPYIGESLLTVGAYVLGCVSTGYYLVRIRTGKDIRRLGSGSAGSRNVARLMGPSAFAATLAGDAAKGVLVAWAALLLGLEAWGVLLAIFAVVAGHIWPIQLAFRGGRGLATAMGAVLVLDYWLVLAVFVMAAITLTLSKDFTLSVLVAVALIPGFAVIIGHSQTNAIGLSLLAALILFAHRENIRRIVRPETGPSGEEV
jgi:glycerol-3-phosphate acyltransferase PlsY